MLVIHAENTIKQELNTNCINNDENENDIIKLKMFKDIFDPKPKSDGDDSEYSEYIELYFTKESTIKSNKDITQIKRIFNISKVPREEKNTKFLKKKRGRQLHIEENNSKNTTKVNNSHDKFAYDNILRKIQVHFISFIISVINKILKDLDYKEQFLKINYEVKKKINKNFFESLKDKTLSDIICNKISNKYKNYDSNYNIEIYNKIKDKEILKNLFKENYLEFFQNIYCKSEHIINLKKYGLEKEIILTNEVKMFNDLLQDNLDENIDNDKYIGSIYTCVKQNYYQDINKIRIKKSIFPKFQTSIN